MKRFKGKKKKLEIIKIGDVEFKVLVPGLLPAVKTEEFERLKNSIKELGVLVPVLTDEDRGIIPLVLSGDEIKKEAI